MQKCLTQIWSFIQKNGIKQYWETQHLFWALSHKKKIRENSIGKLGFSKGVSARAPFFQQVCGVMKRCWDCYWSIVRTPTQRQAHIFKCPYLTIRIGPSVQDTTLLHTVEFIAHACSSLQLVSMLFTLGVHSKILSLNEGDSLCCFCVFFQHFKKKLQTKTLEKWKIAQKDIREMRFKASARGSVELCHEQGWYLNCLCKMESLLS